MFQELTSAKENAAHVPEYAGCLVHFLLKRLICLLHITCTDDDLEEELSETEAPKVKKKKKAKKSSRESKSSKRQRSRREVGLTEFTFIVNLLFSFVPVYCTVKLSNGLRH